MLAKMVARHRQKHVEFRRIRKNCRAPLEDAGCVTESADTAICTPQTDKRTAQLFTFETACDCLFVKPDRFITHAFRTKGARQFKINLGVVWIDVMQVEKNGQRFSVLRSVAQFNRALNAFVQNFKCSE